jgi:hypothetical protein
MQDVISSYEEKIIKLIEGCSKRLWRNAATKMFSLVKISDSSYGVNLLYI